MKAIETRYAGRRFRSRLEARWAVFFDALGVTWEYEPQGFETSAGPYLPDFRVVTFGEPAHFEVKPADAPEDPRHRAFVGDGGGDLIVARGLPASDARSVYGGVKVLHLGEVLGSPYLDVGPFEWRPFPLAELFGALDTARSARFEHSETPATVSR